MSTEKQGLMHIKRAYPVFLGSTVEFRFFKPSIFWTSQFFEPWHISPGFASVKQYNFIPNFSNLRFLETPNISNQFLPPMEEIYKKFTFDFSNP